MKYSPENSRISIIGGGNIGTQFACMFASKGYCVNICSSKPERYHSQLEIVDESGKKTIGRIHTVTKDIGEATQGCKIIFVTHPAFRLKEISDSLLPYIQKGTVLCVIPGTGGAEFAFLDCLKKGAILSGLQRVPSVARLEQYGERVRCEGLRKELHLASIPNQYSEDLADLMSYVWGIPCRTLPNYLSVTLTPGNPILHTTRLRTLFSDYQEGVVYKRNPLFYGEWSNKSSKLLLACDSELQNMVKTMNRLDLRGVKSLKEHYESETIEAMTAKIRSIKSLHNLNSPMKPVEGGWIPDLDSRYFKADFPYGLAIIEAFADILGHDAPNIKETMEWYHTVSKTDFQYPLNQYGIRDLEDIYGFYQRSV